MTSKSTLPPKITPKQAQSLHALVNALEGLVQRGCDPVKELRQAVEQIIREMEEETR